MKRGRSLPKQRFLGKNLINRGCNHLKCWADFSVKRKSPFVLRFYFYIPRPNIPTPSLLKEGGKIFQKSRVTWVGIPKILLEREDNPEKGGGLIKKWGGLPLFYYFTVQLHLLCVGEK